MAGGYYLAFLFGGFITTAARLCRSNLRPLVLPAADSPKTPLTKRTYDFLGMVVTVLLVNFATAPFVLMNVKDSLLAWQRLGWYGIWIVGGALLFFYAGGSRVLRGLSPKKNDPPLVKNEASTLTSLPESFHLPPSMDLVIPPQ